MKKSMILLVTTAFATVMVLKTSGVFAVGESPVEQTMINYQIEDVEDTDIINQEITKKVQEAISSQPRIFKNIISQDTYENYNLDWQYSVRGYNDLLTAIDGNNINASYYYDENEFRCKKIVNNENVYYSYTNDGRIESESSKYGTVEYVYNFMQEPLGFIYENEYYEYQYENGNISGIVKDGECICRYLYHNDVLDGTYLPYDDIRDDGKDSIGNINGYRYHGEYVDNETGWVYSGGRYIDKVNSRYLDGISQNDITKYISADEITYEILSNIYELDFDMSQCMMCFEAYPSAYAATSAATQINIIARVIYFESNLDPLDQIGVAQVIQNRMKNRNMTAYEVVTEGGGSQFLALKKALSDEGTPNSLWSQALENAKRLYWNSGLVYTRAKFDNVDSFRSLHSSFSQSDKGIVGVSFKNVNGTINAKVNEKSYAPAKYVYCPAKDYQSSYITSYKVLTEVWQKYGKKKPIYNVFFTFK